MNVDGAPGLATDAKASLELPNVLPISLGVLLAGLLVTGAGIWVFVAVNRRRSPTTA